jgi:hypothetical protein
MIECSVPVGVCEPAGPEGRALGTADAAPEAAALEAPLTAETTWLAAELTASWRRAREAAAEPEGATPALEAAADTDAPGRGAPMAGSWPPPRAWRRAEAWRHWAASPPMKMPITPCWHCGDRLPKMPARPAPDDPGAEGVVPVAMGVEGVAASEDSAGSAACSCA